MTPEDRGGEEPCSHLPAFRAAPEERSRRGSDLKVGLLLLPRVCPARGAA